MQYDPKASEQPITQRWLEGEVDYQARIVQQQQAMDCSCDWDRAGPAPAPFPYPLFFFLFFVSLFACDR